MATKKKIYITNNQNERNVVKVYIASNKNAPGVIQCEPTNSKSTADIIAYVVSTESQAQIKVHIGN